VYTDDNLLNGLARGDDLVISFLYKTLTQEKIGPYVKSHGGKAEDVKEVVHETLIRVFKNIKLGKYKPQGKFLGYCYRIGRNVWIDLCRKAKKQERDSEIINVGEDPYFEQYEELLEQEELYDKLYSSLETLGARCRKLLDAFYFKNMSYREIASKMDYTEKGAKTQKYKCMNKLRKLFDRM